MSQFWIGIQFILLLSICIPIETANKKTSTKPTYNYMIFQTNCFQQYMNEDIHIMSLSCTCYTISQIFNIVLVPLVLFLRVPQILLIFKNKSLFGLSYFGNILELTMTNLQLAYGLYAGFTIWIYGENILLSIQNFIIILFFLFLSKKDAFRRVILLSATLILSIIFLLQLVPPWLQQSTNVLGLIIFFGARGSQILQNYRHKTTQNLSTKTMSLTLFANFARTFTIIVESPESIGYILNFLIPIFVNGFIVWQIYHYRENINWQQVPS